MEKKSLITGLIIVTVLISIFSILKHQNNNFKIASGVKMVPSVKLASSASQSFATGTVDNLISESPYIVEAVQTGEQTETNYKGVTFATNKLKIKQVLKGDLISTNDVITLLQPQIDEDPVVKKNGHVLLFLEKYSGSIVKDAYVCK
ncbi:MULTISPECIES: hypothetical protein [Clostridium]|uniref:HlyD family secretion protein n=1 Tax=Clostridium frigoriphilum TaxID=443253 RepID=A0ABU7URP4_9CLOT|nr:hypothetical protein [Clostridium sp. DSM 17811]MBU3100875.1 hypothetical protein [Clostridium sp. DSM 17811]